MRWLEIVRLRSAGDYGSLVDELLGQIPALERIAGLVEIRSYLHPEIENDLSVHIFWESPVCKGNGSTIGDQIAYALRELGLVDHSVWIEKWGGWYGKDACK
jgi:hypothetical protein